MKLPQPTDAQKKEIVHSIIAAVARNVSLFYQTDAQSCPVCNGSDAFCPTCNGEGTVSLIEEAKLEGSIKWKSLEKKKYTPNGQYVEGDCTVTLPYEDGLQQTLQRTKYVVVDERKCVIFKWNVQGSPINRIYIILKEDDSPYQMGDYNGLQDQG